MKPWIKNSLYLISFLTIGYGISVLCNTQTKSFRTGDITSAFPFDSRWQPEGSPYLDSPLDIEKALNAPFYFLATGGSAYVFRSENDQYVLKLFQADRLCPPSWCTSFISQTFIPNLAKKIFNKKSSQKNLQFSSYKMALEELPTQTGVVYLHLNPTSHHKNTLTLIDNLGIKHTLPTDQTAFVLQKKASRFSSYFKSLLLNNDLDEAKRLLSDFAFFLKERAMKGIRDGDITPRFNLGMLGKSLVFYDIDQL